MKFKQYFEYRNYENMMRWLFLLPLSTHTNTVQSQSNNAPGEQQEMTDRNCNFFLGMWSGEEKHKYFVCFFQTNCSSDGHLFQTLHWQYNLPYRVISCLKRFWISKDKGDTSRSNRGCLCKTYIKVSHWLQLKRCSSTHL